MPRFTIPAIWQLAGICYIEAETLEEAVDKAYSDDVSLPEGDYIADSFEVDKDSPLFGEVVPVQVLFRPSDEESDPFSDELDTDEDEGEDEEELDDLLASDFLEGKALLGE